MREGYKDCKKNDVDPASIPWDAKPVLMKGELLRAFVSTKDDKYIPHS